MNSRDVVLLGYKLMAEHGLYDWVFKLDRSKRRFGICRYRLKVISLSEPLCNLNGEEEVKNTILHEIAHALAGWGAGHGEKLKTIALSLGCDGDRCYSERNVKTPEKKITLECPQCEKTWKRHRRLPKNRIYICSYCYREEGKRLPIICYKGTKEPPDSNRIKFDIRKKEERYETS